MTLAALLELVAPVFGLVGALHLVLGVGAAPLLLRWPLRVLRAA